MKYQIYKKPDAGEQCWGWRFFDNAGNEVANGGELFVKKNILTSIKNVRNVAKDAPVWKNESPEDQDKGYRFQYDENADGTWHWILRAGNNQTIATSNANYPSEESLKDSLKNIKQDMSESEEIAWENQKDDPAWQEKNDDRTETKGIAGS